VTVYVDNANIPASVTNGPRVHTSRWCHLMSDENRAELLTFARRIGLRPSWIQDKRSGVHFDLTEGKRRQAVAAGAIEVDTQTDEWRRVVAAARSQYIEGGAS
jgi:hypothetical protein